MLYCYIYRLPPFCKRETIANLHEKYDSYCDLLLLSCEGLLFS